MTSERMTFDEWWQSLRPYQRQQLAKPLYPVQALKTAWDAGAASKQSALDAALRTLVDFVSELPQVAAKAREQAAQLVLSAGADACPQDIAAAIRDGRQP